MLNSQRAPESSTISRSQSRSHAANVEGDANSSQIDQIFPIIDDLLKDIELPTILYIILALYLVIQIYSTSFWPGLSYSIDYTTPAGKILKIIFEVAFMSQLSDDDSDYVITFVILFVLSFLTLIVLLAQVIEYKRKRKLIKWTLYYTKFLLEFVHIILLIPFGNFIGKMFGKILNESSPKYIGYFAASIVLFITMLFIQYVQSFFFSVTPYIQQTIIFSWSGSFLFTIFSVVPLFLVIPYIFQVFGRWIDTFLVAIKILFNIYVVYMTFYMPFIRRITNIVVATVFASTTLLDITTFVITLGIFVTEIQQFIIWIVAIVIFGVIFHFTMNKYFNTIRKKLTAEVLESLSSESNESTYQNNMNTSVNRVSLSLDNDVLNTYYSSLKLSRNKRKCELYIRIGLENMSPMFLNWSLIKYAIDHIDDKSILLFCTKVICFFPCESRLLKLLYGLCREKQSLRFHERFMLYQIHSVMNQRQSASSLEITNRLLEMRQASLRGVGTVRDFWIDIPKKPDIFYQIYIDTVKISSYYTEAIQQWPNNTQLPKDYANYLVECATDFVGAVKYQYRSNLIEQGKNYAIDYSFRSMVHIYPYYLKRNVMDVKGNFINKTKRSGSESSSQRSSEVSSNTISGELDPEVEENVSVTLFSQHRLRIAFQRSLENKKSKYSTPLKLSAVFTLFLLAAFLIYFYIYYSKRYQKRQINLESAHILGKVRVGLDISVVTLLMKWGDENHLFSEAFKEEVHSTEDLSINTKNDPIDEALKWVFYGVSSLTNFMSALVTMGSQGEKVVNNLRPVFEDLMVFNFCDEDIMIPKTINTSLRNAFTYSFAQTRSLIQERDTAKFWNTSNEMCTIFSNLDDTYVSYDDMQTALTERQIESKEEVTRMNDIIIIAATLVYAVATTPFLLFNLFKYYRDLSAMLDMMRNIDIEVRKEASCPFKESSNLQQDSISSNENIGSINPYILLLIIILSLIIGIALLVAMILLGEQQNKEFEKLSDWIDDALDRNCYMGEVLLFSTITMMQAAGHITTHFTTINKTAQSLNKSSNNLDKSNDNLLHGLNGRVACVGINYRFDDLNLYETCVPNATGFFKTYQCAPIDKAIALLITLVEGLVRNPENFTIEPGTYYAHIFRIVNNHLIPPGLETVDILIERGQDIISEYSNKNLILAICGIAYCVIALIVFLYLVVKLDRAYKGAIQLLRRIPPLTCNTNPEIMGFLLNKKVGKEMTKMSTAQSVVMMAPDSIICLSRNETIDIINPAIANLFGYTPDQLLGQSINNVLPEADNVEIYNHLELMRQGEASLFFEVDGVGRSDDDQEIPIHVTVVGFCDDNSNEASSFAIVIKDNTVLQKQKKEAEEAKIQSEKLLYNILPRDIVNRINQGETEIFFSVPSATIIFIDIVKWSDYAADLTPSQIMSNLSLIFAKFDMAAAKYNLLTKIKLIGDVYMAAAGLFTPDIAPSQHASQMINFALDSLLCMEESNSMLDASLQVRIGINTDGPLLAGVLGTDKPVFDIIGDPINVASRLQSTCIPSTIQISQTTFNLVNDMSYNIETRGEIELKGKGKKLAYIVRPSAISRSSSLLTKSDRIDTSIFEAPSV